MQRLIVGMTGATGAVFGVRLLDELGRVGVETHLVMSKWAERTLEHETPYTVAQVKAKASFVHTVLNQGAPISSGSFKTHGMVIAPCSVKTLAAITHGFGENLIERSADVVLKEGRKLVLMVRETPLSAIHLENMLKLARMGAVMLPPMPAFYNKPRSLDEMVDHLVARVLDQFDIPNDLTQRWDGDMSRQAHNSEVAR
jgi:4-hydroxy-3-polyprenylbenzoate decarboxylase